MAVAEQLNGVVLESGDTSRFVTAVCGVLDSASGRFTYVNCGHNPPLLLRGRAGRSCLHGGGPALGLFDTATFEAGTVDLAPGDRLVLYTDGVVEPTDDRDREFGTDRLAAAVREAAGRPAAEALRCVIEATRAFAGAGRLRRRLHARRRPARRRVRPSGNIPCCATLLDREGPCGAATAPFAP